jgi:hypothetical protein
MLGWTQLIQSLAILGIVVTALSLMLGIIERSEVLKHLAAIVGLAIVSILLPSMLVNSWEGISIWQKIEVAAICLAVVLLQRLRPHARKTRDK